MSLHASATDELRSWEPPSDGQASLRRTFLDYLADHDDGVWRASAPAHLTASAVIVDPQRSAMLLVLHGKVRRWLQPGGHCELGVASLGEAALREASEESGIAGLELAGGILHLDRHPAPCRPAEVEEHFDVRYLLVAPPGSEPSRSAESLDVRWFPWSGLPHGIEPTIVAMLAAGRERLGL